MTETGHAGVRLQRELRPIHVLTAIKVTTFTNRTALPFWYLLLNAGQRGTTLGDALHIAISAGACAACIRFEGRPIWPDLALKLTIVTQGAACTLSRVGTGCVTRGSHTLHLISNTSAGLTLVPWMLKPFSVIIHATQIVTHWTLGAALPGAGHQPGTVQTGTSLGQTIHVPIPTLTLLTRVTLRREHAAVSLYLTLVQTVAADRTAAVSGGRVGTQHCTGLLKALHITAPALTLLTLIRVRGKHLAVFLYHVVIETVITDGTTSVRARGVAAL